jgi:hypothetical protein
MDEQVKLAHVYVLVRADLPEPIRTVQAVHGAIAATHAFGEPTQPHPNLVICTVPDERSLIESFEQLKAAVVPCCLWREEDLDNSATSIGTAPLRGKYRRALRRYRLLD